MDTSSIGCCTCRPDTLLARIRGSATPSATGTSPDCPAIVTGERARCRLVRAVAEVEGADVVDGVLISAEAARVRRSIKPLYEGV